MILTIDSKLGEDFICEFIPRVLIGKIRQIYLSKSSENMNSYLEKNLNTNIDNIIDSIQFTIIKSGKVFKIDVDTHIIEKNSEERLASLIKLVDYGNLEVKGLNIFNSSFKYVQDNMIQIYYSYELKGGK